MPKKAAKKEEKVEEGDVVPKNDVIFNLDFELKHEKGHFIKLKYNWLNAATLEMEEIETDYLKDWEVTHREGEEEEQEEEDPKDAKKKDDKKKPAKDNKKTTMEEIDDPVPTTVKYVKNFEDSPLKITEEVAHKWADYILKIDFYEYNHEKSEDEYKDSLEIDLSFFLFPEDPLEEEWNEEYVKIHSLDYFNLKITTDNPLLSEFLRKKLNPLQIYILAARDVPEKTDPKYKPVYTICKFVDGQTIRTSDHPQANLCRWAHKHVFLVGQKDPAEFAEQLSSKTLDLELHDCDEEIKEEDKDDPPNFSYGLAKFHLNDLLNSYCFNMKLRSDVFPVKRELANNENNLNLNTTARKEERAIERFSPYLVFGTFYVISVDIAYNIGEFNEQEELKKLMPPPEEEEAKEDDAQAEEEVKSAAESEEEPNVLDSSVVEKIRDAEAAIYERAVYVLPYEGTSELLMKILNSIETINLKLLEFENVKQLNTKEFSEEERENRKLDFIGGFEIMDSEFRMIVIEGLGGKGHSMNTFYKMNERTQPNQKRLKLLYNPEVRFKYRKYWDFGASLKRIKFRDTLTHTMSSPNVFLRSKVPKEIYETLQQLAEMRKMNRIKFLKDYSLFPDPDLLLSVGRKYGDALSHKDLYGVNQKPKRKKKVQQEDPEVTMMLTQQQEETTKKTTFENTMKHSTSSLSVASEAPKPKFSRTMRKTKKNDLGYEPGKPYVPRARMEVPEGQEVFMYSSQRLNNYEQQKENLRKTIAEDKGNFYSYSPDYLGLAFPVVNENEIAVKEKTLNESKWKTKQGFQNVTRKSKAEYSLHPKKPPQDVLDDLKDPFYEQKARKEAAIKSLQRDLIADPNKPEFNLNIHSVGTFSNKEYFNTVFLGGDDVIAEMEEAKRAEHDKWRSKLVVENPHFKVNTRPNKKMQQMDKRRGILEDAPKKIGIRGPQNNRFQTLAAKNIIPCSYTSAFMDEKYSDPKDPLANLKPDDTTKMRTNKGFDTNIRNDTLSYRKTSTKTFIKPLTQPEKVGPKWGKA